MGEHQLIGHVNPRCARCQRTLMQILAAPVGVVCRTRSLPFDAPAVAPVKAALSLPKKGTQIA